LRNGWRRHAACGHGVLEIVLSISMDKIENAEGLRTETLGKYKKLLEIIKEQGSAAVAFSGGVDSSFLCHASIAALGREKTAAITVVSPMLPGTELDYAKKTAALTGIRHLMLEENRIEDEVAANPENRCYFCKKKEFGSILKKARSEGLNTVLDGSNIDDLNDYRPGLKAIEELNAEKLNVVSPLRLAGLTKNEIRALSKHFGLPFWDKPAAACLASRIPCGERIDAGILERIEKGEDYLRSAGFRQFRLRSHNTIARIEVAPGERKRFFNEKLLDDISEKLKSLGWIYVSFELSGYKTGSLNQAASKGRN